MIRNELLLFENKGVKNESNYCIVDNCVPLVPFASLYSAKIGNFHLTARFLSGDKQ